MVLQLESYGMASCSLVVGYFKEGREDMDMDILAGSQLMTKGLVK